MTLIDFLFGRAKKHSDEIEILDIGTFKAATENKNVQLIDVRTAKEYVTGHIKNALNIDYFNRKAFLRETEKLKKLEPVYLYCRSGNRSQKAAKLLLQMGFKNIKDLKGGFLAWEKQA